MGLVSRITNKISKKEIHNAVVAQLTDTAFINKVQNRVVDEVMSNMDQIAMNIAGEIEDEVCEKVSDKLVLEVEEEIAAYIDVDEIVEDIREEF